jgi:hypothetical protein
MAVCSLYENIKTIIYEKENIYYDSWSAVIFLRSF